MPVTLSRAQREVRSLLRHDRPEDTLDEIRRAIAYFAARCCQNRCGPRLSTLGLDDRTSRMGAPAFER